MNRAIFIDRDGVINKLPPKYPNDGIGDIRNYITKWEDFEFLPGVEDAFKLIESSDYIPIIVSNQGGAIGRELVSYDAVFDIFDKMAWRLFDEDTMYALVGRFYFCPHLLSDNCACVKPKPGMLYQAAIEHDIVLAESWMIGDSDTDIEAGAAAGLTHLIKIDNSNPTVWQTGQFNQHFELEYFFRSKPSLLDVVKFILKHFELEYFFHSKPSLLDAVKFILKIP